jgi:hypothetical protein
MARAKHDPRESGFAEKTELMGEKRLAGDVDEQLGYLLGDRTQAGCEATGKKSHRKIGKHWKAGKGGRR